MLQGNSSDRLLLHPFPAASIHLREKNIVGPTEEINNAQALLSSEGRTDVFR